MSLAVTNGVISKEIAAYTKWLRRMAKDQRLLATHISLYTALFICYQRQDFAQPFSVCRRELMGLVKLRQ